MRLCASMFLKGLFTSDIDYQPGISASEARKLGLLDQGISPVPREMAYPLTKGADWHQLYDYIKFPPGNKVAQFGIIANAKTTLRPPKANTVHGSSRDGSLLHEDKTAKSNQRETSKDIYHKKESKVPNGNGLPYHLLAVVPCGYVKIIIIKIIMVVIKMRMIITHACPGQLDNKIQVCMHSCHL